MARKRMIDPEFWLDEDLAALSAYARLLYIGLWGICDDNHATLPLRPGWIKAQVFPYNDINIDLYIDELIEAKKLKLFHAEDEKYLFIKNFFKYQKVDHPSSEKYPKFQESSEIPRESSESPRSQYNIIQSNLIQSKLATSKKERSEPSSQVNEVFKVFSEINPTINWGNKTSRKAASELIKRFGLDGTIQMARQVISVQGERYAPTATTPYQMKEKLAQFKIYFDKQKPKEIPSI